MSDALTHDEANAVYDALVAHVGLDEGGREEFVLRQTQDFRREMRIGGSLGFGGKFRRNVNLRADGTWGMSWYIDAYPEDTTPAVQAILDATNPALDALRVIHEHHEPTT